VTGATPLETLQPRLNLVSHIEIYNGYPASLVVALMLHFTVLAALVYSGVTQPSPNPEIVQPSIRAFTLEENPQLRNERLQQRRVAEQQQRDRQAELQRQAEEQRLREAEEAARRAEQERLAEQQRQAEQLRQRQEVAERERLAELQRQREAEQQARAREQEQQRQRELAAEQDRQRREAEAASAAAEVARAEQEMVMAYTGIIHDLVQQNWSRPPSARNGMTVVFRIQMVPTGDILDVQLVQSSGDYAFDRAAETAIYRVGRFQELQGMPINMFNENFRSLLLTFRPEDLLN